MPLFSHTTDIGPSFVQKVLFYFAEELSRKASSRQALSKAIFSCSISHFVSVFVFYFSVLLKDKLFAVFLFAWKEVPVCPRNLCPLCALGTDSAADLQFVLEVFELNPCTVNL